LAQRHPVSPGHRYPPGATPDETGVNFAVFSRHATFVELRLYRAADSPKPFQVVRLDPAVHRTFFSWHVHVEGLPVGTHYTWRVDGPRDTARTGWRFDPNRELVDPWARAVTDVLWDRRKAMRNPAPCPSVRGIVVNDDGYDWEGDEPVNHPIEDTVVYEMHVGGFTRHPSSKAKHPGTFAGLVERIPYLVDLGVTDVELLPIMAFDEQDVPEPVAARGLRNYWGYSTHSFWSPHPRFCVTPHAGTHRREFRDMVKALHRAGIGVILDVVFNHTAEGGAIGPVMNFKGLGNDVFYHLDAADRRLYRDYSGCGNTVQCNHPIVSSFVIECLEYWVREMHVDGFRFDLASALARGDHGVPMANPPVLWGIELSDVLAHTRIIAEAWDAAGLYQVGSFPGYRWSEWNGRYRDVIRRFVRGDAGIIGEVATRLAGSSDLYRPAGRLPTNSINFVTCHDGFTLWDLVSYARKHNERNGEGNRDGHGDNLSSNAGVEGETRDPDVLEARRRRAKAVVATLLLSQGVPMLHSGDEVLRTQGGNNNAYCQDNEIGWLDWSLVERNADFLRFTREMIALRKRHPSLRRSRFLTGRPGRGADRPDIAWHGPRVGMPPWSDPEARALAFTLDGVTPDEEVLHVVLNMGPEAVPFELPRLPGPRWHRAVDTALASPDDVVAREEQAPVEGRHYVVGPGAVVVLEAR
jgi:isoamylase